MKYKWQKILITRTDRIGDLVISTPVIENLRKAFPNSFIAFLCQKKYTVLLQGNPFLDEVIGYDKQGKEGKVWGAVKFAYWLRRKNFDVVFILHPHQRINLLSYFAGIPLRIGWDYKKSRLFLNKVFSYDKHLGECHELEYNLKLLEYMGISIVSRKMFVPTNKKYQESLIKKYPQLKEDNLRFVFHPSASCRSKKWPEENFIKLAERLYQKYKAEIIFVSQEKSNNNVDFLQHLPFAKDLRGKLSLGELIALLNRADLLVSNDSGPVHIASALGIGVISIFGRSDKGLAPARWRPLGPYSQFIHKPENCLPCQAHNCTKGFKCLTNVSVEEVFQRCNSLLERFLIEKRRKSIEKRRI